VGQHNLRQGEPRIQQQIVVTDQEELHWTQVNQMALQTNTGSASNKQEALRTNTEGALN